MLVSLHFNCVLGILLIPHSKSPGNWSPVIQRETHAKSERIAPKASVARHLRRERHANSGISHDHKKTTLAPQFRVQRLV